MVSLKIIAELKDAQGSPLADKPIDFYYSYDGSTFTKIASVNTDTNGIAEISHETDRTTWYKARFEGDSVYDASEAVEKYEIPITPTKLTEQLTNLMMLMMQILIIMALMSTLMALIRRER